MFHQVGKVEPRVDSDIVLERTHNAIVDYQKGPLMDYVPYTDHTKRLLYELSEFNPQTLAIMHGSTYSGDGATLLKELEKIFKEVFTV